MRRYREIVPDPQPAGCFQQEAASLSKILQAVPVLLDLLPLKSLAALLAVNQAHCRQVYDHVRHIAVPDQTHIETLVRGTWPRLLAWHIGDSLTVHSPAGKHSIVCCSLPNASDAAVLVLAKGDWPRLGELQLNGGSISV